MKESLVKDWLESRDSSAVKRVNENKLNWEGIQGKGSKFIFGDLSHISDEKKLGYAYDIASKRLIALGLSTTRLNLDNSNKTNGKVIYIDSKCMDDVNLSVNESLDVICGELVHEAAHVLYTDFGLLNSFKVSELEHHIANIIEDERIERLISEDYPGYIEEIAVLKKYVFDVVGEDPINKLDEIMHCLFHFVRYPKMLNMVLVDKYEEMLVKIKNILVPYPTKYPKVLSVSREIAKILVEEFEKEEEPENESNSDQGQDDKENATSNTESNSENQESKGNKEEEKNSGDNAQFENKGEPKSQEKPKGKQKSNNSTQSPKKEQTPAKDLKSSLQEIKTKWEQITSSNEVGVKKENSVIVVNNKLFVDEQDGVFDLKYGVNFKKPQDGNNKEYLSIKMTMGPYIGKIRTKLAILEQSEKNKLIGLKNGRLDENKLVEALQGVDTVYTREEFRETNRVSLVILIDESGSMSGEVNFMGSQTKRINVVKHLSIMLNEAFKNSKNVDLFIYGHTVGAGSSTLIRIYKEKGTSKGKSLTSMFADDYNRDGVAIDEVAKRVRALTKSRGLFVVLSDGQPNAPGYRGEDGIKHTKRAVDRLERNRFIPLQIGIETKYRENPMFRNWIDFENMDKMVKQFGNIVSKFIQENI